jgi:hypothetical protein
MAGADRRSKLLDGFDWRAASGVQADVLRVDWIFLRTRPIFRSESDRSRMLGPVDAADTCWEIDA